MKHTWLCCICELVRSVCLHTWHLNFCCGISLGGFILPQSKVSPSQEVTVTVTLHCTRKVLEGIPPQYFFKDIPLYSISGKTPSHKYLWNFSLTVKLTGISRYYLAVSLWKYSLTVSLWKYSLTVSLKVYFTSQYLSGSIPSQYLSGSITSQYLSKYLPRSISLEVLPHSIPLQLCKYSFTLQNSFSQYCLKRLASHNMFPSIFPQYILPVKFSGISLKTWNNTQAIYFIFPLKRKPL